MNYDLYVNEENTKAVKVWENGVAQIMERDTPDDVWSPPIRLLKKSATL